MLCPRADMRLCPLPLLGPPWPAHLWCWDHPGLACLALPCPGCSAVEHLALRKMQVAFQAWRCCTAQQQRHRAILQQGLQRVAWGLACRAWASWASHVAQARVDRHRVEVVRRRQQARLLRGVVAAWREVAAAKVAERQLVRLCLRRTDRHRAAAALQALAANARQAAARRAQMGAAASLYAQQLQARALAALSQGVRRRRAFEQQLGAVAAAASASLVKASFSAWRDTAMLAAARRRMVAAAGRRLARLRLQACLAAWRQLCQVRRAQEVREGVALLAAIYVAALLMEMPRAACAPKLCSALPTLT